MQAEDQRLDPLTRQVRRPLLLHMEVKGSTTVSSKNQVTLPVRALEAAGVAAGDRLRVIEAEAGRIVLQRVEDIVDQVAGRLTGLIDRAAIESLDEEWD